MSHYAVPIILRDELTRLVRSFASPEVLRGERYGGKETDIWALGVLAYVILCGEVSYGYPILSCNNN